jgi:F0F1-type ATP synthase gamma subunit
MKKQNRILKINDNFSLVELYFENEANPDMKNIAVLVIVNSRTFSGRYQLTVTKEQINKFEWDRKNWLKKVQKGKQDEKLYFESNYQNICIEITALSDTKIQWDLMFKPFLPDIELLQIRMETELSLVNSFRWGVL